MMSSQSNDIHKIFIVTAFLWFHLFVHSFLKFVFIALTKKKKKKKKKGKDGKMKSFLIYYYLLLNCEIHKFDNV